MNDTDIDYEEQARQLLAIARSQRETLFQAQQENLIRYENSVWRAAFEAGMNQGWREGWSAALQHLQQAASSGAAAQQHRSAAPEMPLATDEDSDEPTPSAQEAVLRIVSGIPGLRGIEIVEKINLTGVPVKERAVRTALHRLKKAGKIRNVDERWYPPEGTPTP